MDSKSCDFQYIFTKRVNLRWSKIDHPQMYYVWLKHSTSWDEPTADCRPQYVFYKLKNITYILVSTQTDTQDVLWITKQYNNAWFDVSNPQSLHKSFIFYICYIYTIIKECLWNILYENKDLPLASNHIQSIHYCVVVQKLSGGMVCKIVQALIN